MTPYRTIASETLFAAESLDLPFEKRRPRVLQAARDFLEEQQRIIREGHREGASGRQIVQAQTAMIDTLVQGLYRQAASDFGKGAAGRCVLVSIGGYGRGELNPLSDIDLMFHYAGKDQGYAETVSERVLYFLWDLGLDVGYSVRTDRDCLEMADRDITARTALLDSRYLAGDRDLYQEYEKGVLESIVGRNSQGFIREKIEENDRRLKKYGSSVYLLEPNIKEGEGGLRDLHTAVWVARVKFKASGLRDLVHKGILSEREFQEFEEAFDYLWRIRNELHYLSGRKNDQIHFDHQEKIARFLGYEEGKDVPAVEQFMQDYYEHATRVEHLSSSLVAKATQRDDATFRLFGYFTRRAVEDGFYILRGELGVTRTDLFEKDPALMMKAFELAQRHQARLGLQVKTLIRDSLHLVNDKVRRSRAMSESFLALLRNPKGLARTLREMHHLRFLNRFIPEFGRIYCKVQHDAYHIYTVDIHSLFAVEEILKLWEGEYLEKKPLLSQVANDVEKRELLLLGVLFHDIGKGEGKDHCNKGADLIPTIARRLGLHKEDSQRLEFLVRNHLEMAHLAQRRDLHDDKLILQFARQMGMSENLKMLYLLSFADIKAVGPGVWTEWKGRLLQELYEKAYQVLERGNFRLEDRSEKVRNRKRKVVERLGEDFGEKTVKEALRSLSTRYLLSYRSVEIAEHLRLALARGDRSLVMKVEHEPEAAYTQLTISTLDIPGLFSKITGVMAANGLNILGAQIHTRYNGEVLDILQVRSPAGEAVTDPARWARVEEHLCAVVEGRVRVEELVKKRQRPSFLVERARPRIANRVVVDNEISDEYTVLDIYAKDRVGLLYEITRTLLELGLYIGVAKISTKVDQAADTFYVQDIFGQKVRFAEKLEEVSKKLQETLDTEE